MAQPCCCMHPSLGQACDCTSWLRENAHSHPHLGLIHVLGCEPRGVEHGLAGALALRLRDFRAVLVQSKRHLNSWAGGALLQNLRDAGDDPAWPPTPSPLQRPAQSRPTGRSGELHRAMSEAQRGGGPTLIIRPRPGSHAWLTEIPPPPQALRQQLSVDLSRLRQKRAWAGLWVDRLPPLPPSRRAPPAASKDSVGRGRRRSR